MGRTIIRMRGTLRVTIGQNLPLAFPRIPWRFPELATRGRLLWANGEVRYTAHYQPLGRPLSGYHEGLLLTKRTVTYVPKMYGLRKTK